MKSTKVEVTLSMEQEFDLMSKYGRRCSREGLVMRAITDAIKSNGAAPKEAPAKKSRKKKADKPPITEGAIAVVCSKPCGWSGMGTLKDHCPDCGAYVLTADGDAIQG